MTKVHDKFVIELAEVIKGYGNDPDVDDPFHLSEFYRFYELPEIAVSANHFKTMIPLELEIAKAIENLPSAQPEVLACGSGELIAQAEWTELKQEFLRMASYIDVLLECSDEQRETLLNFISKLTKYMPWEGGE